MAKFILGATERVKKDDSIPVELLPSNKLLYVAKLNSDEDASSGTGALQQSERGLREIPSFFPVPRWNRPMANRSIPNSRSRR